MSYLVSGAHGFIGTHLVETLKATGHTVQLLPRSFFTDPDIYESPIKSFNPQVIIHLAVSGNMRTHQDSAEMLDINIGGTFNLLEITSEIAYKAFINVSSSSVLLPHQTMYSATKLGAEALCKAYYDEYDKPIATIRPFSIYGPSEASHRFIPTVFRSCLAGAPMTLDPDATHDWVYIDDMVRALINTADNIEQFKGKALNVGTGFSYTNSQVMQIIEDITDKRANVIETKKMRSYDSENWKSDTRAGEYIKLREGLMKYYDSIR